MLRQSRKAEKWRKLEEESKERDEVVFWLRQKLRAMKEAPVPAVKSDGKAQVIEVGVQAFPDMVDASTEPWEETLVEASGNKRGGSGWGR